MKRSCLILLSSAASAIALAVPGVAQAGWTWSDGAAGVDGWTWSDSAAQPTAATADPSPDGWSWGEADAAPADPTVATDPALATDPSGWSWGGEAAPAPAP